MEYFKLNESPFYHGRPKPKSGAEINVKVSYNYGNGKVSVNAPAWVFPRKTFNLLFLN